MKSVHTKLSRCKACVCSNAQIKQQHLDPIHVTSTARAIGNFFLEYPAQHRKIWSRITLKSLYAPINQEQMAAMDVDDGKTSAENYELPWYGLICSSPWLAS